MPARLPHGPVGMVFRRSLWDACSTGLRSRGRSCWPRWVSKRSKRMRQSPGRQRIEKRDPHRTIRLRHMRPAVWSMTAHAARELAPEAFKEALLRYPNDVEGALTFFGYAIGLGVVEPTPD